MSEEYFYVFRLERWKKGDPASHAGVIASKGKPTIGEAADALLAAANQNVEWAEGHADCARAQRSQLKTALMGFARRLANE